ncbi:pseudo histidine-containing phosphotransfer protein 5-like [Tripterygium wilfordii]|uniref:pseudo histidine-containing phosphotransfer protein 5-like n=1 Tax=Tripterygium wilfordii TaxID=458696 RepID=UPI0018F84B7C|nr:pseudo histidine-containing phosphotransfer protein 5-like [Tripterygium wilfordii]
MEAKIAIIKSFFDEGILDKQFCMLQELEDEGNPDFVEEVITLFIRDSTKIIATVEQMMVRTQVELTRTCLVQRNMQGASAALDNLKREQAIFKAKLEHYFKMLSEAGSGKASEPPK